MVYDPLITDVGLVAISDGWKGLCVALEAGSRSRAGVMLAVCEARG